MKKKPNSKQTSTYNSFQTVGEMLEHEKGPDRRLYDTHEKFFVAIWKASNHPDYFHLDSVSFLIEPRIFELLCEFLARGGTFREIILKLGLNVHQFLQRVEQTPEIKKMWKMAMERREETIRETFVSTHLNIIEADVRELYGEDGVLLEMNKLPDQVARVVKKVKYNKFGGVESIELYDKQRSVDSLRKSLIAEKAGTGDHGGIFSDILRKADKRAAEQFLNKNKLVKLNHEEKKR